MVQLAICDDEIEELNTVAHMCDTYCGDFEEHEFLLRRFEGADRLLETIEKEAYAPDLVLMDIYMPGTSGMEMAKKLREMGNPCRIVFLTSSKEHALEAFSVNAFQYLVKPVSTKALFSVLDEVLAQMREQMTQYLLFQTENHVCRVAVSDIVYCEAQRKKQCVHLAGGERIVLNMTMKKLCEMIEEYKEFAKVGVSYLVNVEHIERLSNRMLWLDNKKEIYLPRGSYKMLREKYFNYYCGKCE